LEKDNSDQKKTIEDQKTEIAKLNDMLSSWMRMVVGAGVPIGGLLMAIALPVCIWINKTLGAISAVLGVCMLVMSLAILKFYNDFAVIGGIIVLFILVGGIGFAIWSAKSHADIKDAFEETRDHIDQDIKPTLSSEQFEKIYGRSGSYISQMSSKSYDLIKKLEKKI